MDCDDTSDEIDCNVLNMDKSYNKVSGRAANDPSVFTITEQATMKLAVSNENLTPEGGALRMC